MSKTVVTRAVEIPDRLRLARYARAPELGPRVLFFSGGTALRAFSQELINYTHNSVHIITPFDSGGSSAVIRKAFNMLAVGDLRNRIMALADRSIKGAPPIFELFAHRLPQDEPQDALRERLDAFVNGCDPMICDVPDPMRKIIRTHLRFFTDRMPRDFDLRGASIGNLILTGGFFNYQRHIDPVIYLFSKLVEAHGKVRPTVNADLHLAVELEDGRIVVGQHLITGKEAPPLTSRITRLFLVKSLQDPTPVEVAIRSKVDKHIRTADLICYPIGSFYTSLIANLLPKGVGDAVSAADCPKIFIPNCAPDPEQLGLGVVDSVRVLVEYLERSCQREEARDRLLNFVLIDSKNGAYPRPLDLHRLRRLGVEVIDAEFITPASKPHVDERLLIELLLSLT